MDRVWTIAGELEAHDAALAARDRWLVLNKLDAVTDEAADALAARFADAGWQGPVFRISAATGEGCDKLMQAVHQYLVAENDGDDDA